jgi:hypothetical protein
VLIVKNMGTVGLDAGHIKDMVFIGTVRELAAWLQAVLRGATKWKNFSHMTVFFLNDSANRSNWENLIVNQGGEFTHTELEKTGEEIIKKKKGDDVDNPLLEVEYATLNSAEDSHVLGEISEDVVSDVYRLIAKEPFLRERMSIIEIANLIEGGVLTPPDKVDDVPVISVKNAGKECEDLADELKELTKEVANMYCSYHENPKRWVEERIKISAKAKAFGGLRQEPANERDPARLRNAKRYVEEEYERLKAMRK